MKAFKENNKHLHLLRISYTRIDITLPFSQTNTIEYGRIDYANKSELALKSHICEM